MPEKDVQPIETPNWSLSQKVYVGEKDVSGPQAQVMPARTSTPDDNIDIQIKIEWLEECLKWQNKRKLQWLCLSCAETIL